MYDLCPKIVIFPLNAIISLNNHFNLLALNVFSYIKAYLPRYRPILSLCEATHGVVCEATNGVLCELR